ncbi:MAG: glycoside hydrolase family 127 protein [Treponema sp.]|jgi:DUF1680 family protein|nr:glycoside hydrolase family 127 protein [Treponema sp.]
MTNTTRITGGFWARTQELVMDVVLPFQGALLEDQVPGAAKSHAIENFRIAAGEAEGAFHGMVFQDSDVAKWLEAAAYALAVRPDAALEEKADSLIALLGRAQREDGYIDTYFIVKEPERKWQNLRECHELYCAGHLIEAAVAYYEATGKDAFLSIMQKTANLICDRFGPEPGKKRGIPGHEEIELALLRLYRLTGERRCLETARYFIDARGAEPDYFAEEAAACDWRHWGPYNGDRRYAQNHAPVREQKAAAGHAVRALYLYTAMADLVGLIDDEALFSSCVNLWQNITQRQMYLTGGIGASAAGEAFSADYDLPNDTAYAETCAACALVFFARRLIDASITPAAEYADVIEKEFYNGALAGMQLDGKKFFYVNPLESVPGVSGVLEGYKHALPQRPAWFGCACCPPNLARLVLSLGRYLYSQSGSTIYCHLFAESESRFKIDGSTITLKMTTGYPWKGDVDFAFEGNAHCTLALRIPGWCGSAAITLNGEALEAERRCGYALIERDWQSGDTLRLALDMRVTLVEANPHVREDAGRLAVMRGPLVYCLEEADNGPELWNVSLGNLTPADFTERFEPDFLGGVVTLSSPGKRRPPWQGDTLYRPAAPGADAGTEACTLRWIPYYAWSNRGLGGMCVWVRR